ncbi:RNA-dependent RNA polymerase [Pleurotus pulmonarius]
MNLNIQYIPRDAGKWDVTRKLAEVLHSNEFSRREPGERVLNFKISLGDSKLGGVRNDGSGVLTLPDVSVGDRFLRYVKDRPIKMGKQRLRFYRAGPPSDWLAKTLERTHYVDPDVEERHEAINNSLGDALRVDAIQLGVFYRPSYPRHEKDRLVPRAFSIEWEKDLVSSSSGWLYFSYDHKLLYIEVGDSAYENRGFRISIPFHSIKVIGAGYDGKPYLCFDTHTPPILESIEFYRALKGDHSDGKKVRRRVGALDEGHAAVAPFAHQLRIVLFRHHNEDTLEKFISLCKNAELETQKLIIRCDAPGREIDAHRKYFFASTRQQKRLYQMELWVKSMPWAVSFQIEHLMRNGLLNTEDLLDHLRPYIDSLLLEHADDNGAYVGDFLRHYGDALQAKPARQSPLACFQRELGLWNPLNAKLPPGEFNCCHVTFTPTRLLLEGPYPIQSNRVIRQYSGHEEHFIRVDFRDEDMLQYRWDRAVDGASFVRERVGPTLKEGFELGGRRFEFLAYSSSALREHAVWFMNPFQDEQTGRWVTSETIRQAQGDFNDLGNKKFYLLNQPSKYAARLAQAFTATDPSVDLRRNQWEQVEDIASPAEAVFTDGCGTISHSLAVMIWAALLVAKRVHENAPMSTIFQIRFLGYKGVVSVDRTLDKRKDGVLMLLRDSMHKFKHPLEDDNDSTAALEIAQWFSSPMPAYLNRPLTMLLEDCGVKQEAFLGLQKRAVAQARMIHDSLEKFEGLLSTHNFGGAFGLSFIVKNIRNLGLDISSSSYFPFLYDSSFLQQLRQALMLHLLVQIKHEARILIPESYLLVGVADEGPAHVKAGHSNVYSLEEGLIYVCIQGSSDEEPTWLRGSCIVGRSPVVHPGDVQRVTAIGKPPEGKICSFAGLKNVVVFASKGRRPLPSSLGGGDLDGDTYFVIQYPQLLAPKRFDPASYQAIEPKTLERDCSIDDVCDFVVEYINSDVLGLISDRHLIIADQSKKGTNDVDCIRLAQLHSMAVDYAKHGNPVDIDEDGPNPLPKTLIRCKPDWHAKEVVAVRQTDYYESDRALGQMYRAITLEDPEFNAYIKPDAPDLGQNTLLLKLRPIVQKYIAAYQDPDGSCQATQILYEKYRDELRYICGTHTLTNEAGTKLTEVEVVLGVILAKSMQKSWKSNRSYRMRRHMDVLVKDVRRQLFDETDMREGLERGWNAWFFSLLHPIDFGANSFGLIGLRTVFNCLERLGEAVDGPHVVPTSTKQGVGSL